jgi:hypothetical protein
VAVVNDGGKRLGIDRDNKLFALRGKWLEAALPEIIASNESDRKEILDLMENLQPRAKQLFVEITKFGIESLGRVYFDLKSGARIYWGDTDKSQIKPKLDRIAQVFQSGKPDFKAVSYINLYYFDKGRVLLRSKISDTKLSMNIN